MEIKIDPDCGFCFGVRHAIRIAEEKLKGGPLSCLGEMVHNEAEVARLERLGMTTFYPEKGKELVGGRVLIRAHGEPPETYTHLREVGAEIVDATCPIVVKLQKQVKQAFDEEKTRSGQIIIFGEPGHPEIMGLNGQTGYHALIIAGEDDFEKIDFKRPAQLFSQTTMDAEAYLRLAEKLNFLFSKNGQKLTVHSSSCRQVSGRMQGLRSFAKSVDVLVFVTGKHSSNGKALYEVCRAVNSRSYKISLPKEIDSRWFDGAYTCGISGATSTPPWLLEQVADFIREITA